MLLLQYADAVLNAKSPLFIFFFFIRINTFIELYALPSDLILHIKLCQQCRVQNMATKVTSEQQAPMLQAETRPSPQDVMISEVLLLLHGEEPHAISSTRR